MTEKTLVAKPPKPTRTRHVRSAATRARSPARVPHPEARSHGLPSPRRVLALQVVAWHNKHPLARRISRRDLGGYGVLSLPFSPQAGEGDTGSPRFPMFDDLSLIPGLSRSKVVQLALTQGWDERPGAAEWPLRKVRVAKGWDKSQAQPIYLLTVALKRGKSRSTARLLVGRSAAAGDPRGVIGHRWSSQPRLALAGLAVVLPMLFCVWGVKQLLPTGRPSTAPLVAEASHSTSPAPTRDAAPARTRDEPRRPAPVEATPVPSTAAPDDILPPPRPRADVNAPDMPRVGSGMPTGMDPRAARAGAPERFRLIGPAVRDQAALRTQAKQMQSVLQSLGNTGKGLRMDVIGTPEGDAVSIGPLADQAEAERVAKRLAARGITMRVSSE